MAVILSGETGSGVLLREYNKRFIYFISIVVALGGLLFGFDLSIISGTVHSFQQYYQLDEAAVGWAVGCINLGAALGALIAGKVNSWAGRKKSLILCALLFAATGVGTGWATQFTVFIVFRVLSGIALGMAAFTCPVYIAEIAPPTLRGKLVALYQLAITIGILLAYISNYALLGINENDWRWMFSAQTIPSLVFLLGILFVPESPRWLILKNKIHAARSALVKIGSPDLAEKEIYSVKESLKNNVNEHTKIKKQFRYSYFFLLGIIIACFSQLAGQNSIFSYAPEIFNQAGGSLQSSFFQSILVGLVNMIFTIVAILTVDKFGRKKLLLSGTLLLFLTAMLLGISFITAGLYQWSLYFVLGFIAIFSASMGPVTWVMLSEIFPNAIRDRAMSVATLSLWIANFFTTASFPILKSYFGLTGTFMLHSMMCLIYFFFVKYNIPETKGKSLEEIEILLSSKNKHKK